VPPYKYFMFTKLIFTVVVVIVAWKAFKFFARVQEQRERRADGDAKADAPGAHDIEDMAECEVCQSYVARGSKSCGKDGCPYGR